MWCVEERHGAANRLEYSCRVGIFFAVSVPLVRRKPANGAAAASFPKTGAACVDPGDLSRNPLPLPAGSTSPMKASHRTVDLLMFSSLTHGSLADPSRNLTLPMRFLARCRNWHSDNRRRRLPDQPRAARRGTPS